MFLNARWRRFPGQKDVATVDHRIRAAAEGLEPRTLFSSLVWSNGPALPAAVGNAVPLNSGLGLLVMGGTNSAGASSSNVYALDPLTGQWTTAPALDQGRAGAGVGTTSGYGPVITTPTGTQFKYSTNFFVFGGQNAGQSTASSLNYDPYNNDAESVAATPMIAARSLLASATDPATGQLYAIGGLNGSTALAGAERYDPSADSWSPIAPLPQAVYSAAAVADGEGHIFVIGGDNSSGQLLSTVYRYTIATDS